MSAMLMPVYAAAKTAGAVLAVPDPRRFAEILTNFANAGLVALIALIFFQLLLDYEVSARAACVTTLLLSISTSLAVYGRGLFNDALTGLVLLIAFRGLKSGRLVLAGLACGAAFATRAEYALVVPIFALAAGVKKMHRLLIPAIGVGIVLALFNYARFGSPFDQGTLTEHPTDRFDTPLGVGLSGLLYSPGKGVIWFAPPIILALFGMKEFFRKHRVEWVAAAGVALALLVVHAKWHSWMGGWSFGPRRLIALLPLIMIPACFTVERYLKQWAGTLALAALGLTGFVVQLGGLTTNFMKYIAAANQAGVSTIWSVYHAPAAGQLYCFLKLGERDLWYYYLFRGDVVPQAIAATITASVVFVSVLLVRSLKE